VTLISLHHFTIIYLRLLKSLRLENNKSKTPNTQSLELLFLHIFTEHSALCHLLYRRNNFPPLHELGLQNTKRKMYFYIDMHIFKVSICSKVIEKSQVPGDGGGFTRI